jgi:hypothetical protein
MSTQCPTCGKRMDSSWKHCPYCVREEQGKKKKDGSQAAPSVEASMADERQHTRVANNAPHGERKTELYSSPAPERPPRSMADNRRIVGALVSYTMHPNGRLFEIYQGRNHIGAGEIRGEDRPVDIQYKEDHMLSADHAMILVQGTEFLIQDLASVNGTFVNGKQIRPGVYEPLTNPAEVRTGQTVFTFVRFDVPAGAAPVQRAEEPPAGSRAPTKLV